MANTQPARGMRDFLPADVRRREYVIGIIKEVYERYGFEPLETPAVENIETLMGKYGEEGNQLIFKILKRGVHEGTGEADLALRYDLTVPLARVVAEYKDKLPRIFKRYQIQPVWRADRPARGRFREFYQCDVDILGSHSMIVEAELCAAASEALTRLGFTDFTIRLNHRQVLTGMLEAAGVSPDRHADALVSLDKLDKIGRSGVAKELAERGISEDASKALLDFFEAVEELEQATRIIATMGESAESEAEMLNAALLGRMVEFVGDHEEGARGIDELHSVVKYAAANGSGKKIKIDPSLARGLSYYTGTIMEINVPDLAGSLGGGGRYDKLIGSFLGQDIPACGFSLGLERIIVVMTARKMFHFASIEAPADVMVAIWDEQSIGDSLMLASDLRNEGLRVDVYIEADKPKKQFKYASSQHIPFVALIGPDERIRGDVMLKDMRSGKQRSVKRNKAGIFLRDELRVDIGQSLQVDSNSDWNAVANKVAFAFGSYRKRARFITMHQKYFELLPNLLKSLNLAFVNLDLSSSRLDIVIQTLDELCIDDFSAILLLCLDGYGDGAIQILPGMYERVVTARYLNKYPEKLDDFWDYYVIEQLKYGHLDSYKLDPDQQIINRFKLTRNGGEESFPPWNTVNFADMAKEVNLGEHIREGYIFPQLYTHPSMTAVLSKWEGHDDELTAKHQSSQRTTTDVSLPMAYLLILEIIGTQIEHFDLDDPIFQQCVDEFAEVLLRM